MSNNRSQCISCRYFQPAVEVGNQGECRYNPPQALPMQQMTERGPTFNVIGFFTPVAPHGWCGKHETAIVVN